MKGRKVIVQQSNDEGMLQEKNVTNGAHGEETEGKL